jgi:tetratricopeptide (TPR) repeat protein
MAPASAPRRSGAEAPRRRAFSDAPLWLAVLWLAQAAGQNTNGPAPASSPLPPEASALPTPWRAAPLGPTNEAVAAAWRFFTATNPADKKAPVNDLQAKLELARHLRISRQFSEAAAACIGLIEGQAPEKVQRNAFLELAEIALAQNNLPRAEQIYAQCLAHWPKDPGVPELLLRQGMVFRRMGLPNMAIAKFYAVMTSSLVLRTDRLEFYKQLVQLAQNEIAQTQYELGNYQEAAGSFDRLLRSDSPPVNYGTVQYQYIRCLTELGRPGDAITQAREFLDRFPAAPERPEVRFLCALALKQVHRDGEALRQVLELLQEQRTNAPPDPQTLAYWQRRAGNELANRFYLEGDWLKALDIYVNLQSLDASAQWQLPIWYQIALVFERLQQQGKAIDYLQKVIRREKEVPASGPASLQAIIEMAKWREGFLTWHTNAEMVSLDLHRAVSRSPQAKTNDNALPDPLPQ